MKVDIVKEDVVCRLPKVGELWKHVNKDMVFMRVDDCALEKNVMEHSFASVVLKSGGIVQTLRGNSGGRVILEQIEPLRVKKVEK